MDLQPIRNRLQPIGIVLCAAFICGLPATSVTLAAEKQFPHTSDSRDARIRHAEAKTYLKYRKVTTANFQRSADGNGYLFFVAGDLSPKEASAASAIDIERTAATAATAFLNSEAEFLDLSGPSDTLRERSRVREDDGAVHILFDKFIAGLRVERMDVRVHVNPEGAVVAFSGHVEPLSPASRALIGEAAATARITKDSVLEVIAQDLGVGVNFSAKSEKLAIASEPFVVWDADATAENGLGRWLYRIDARTGAIVSKKDYLQTAGKSQAQRPSRVP